MDTALLHGVAPAPGPRYVHDALFYSSPDELAAATVPFVREGLAAGDAVVVTASPATADVVRTAVDDDRVRVLPWTEAYARSLVDPEGPWAGLKKHGGRFAGSGSPAIRALTQAIA